MHTHTHTPGRVIGNRIAASLASSSTGGISHGTHGAPSSLLGDAPPETPGGEGGAKNGGITEAEMAKHNSEHSCWVSIDDQVCVHEGGCVKGGCMEKWVSMDYQA